MEVLLSRTSNVSKKQVDEKVLTLIFHQKNACKNKKRFRKSETRINAGI